MYMTVLLVVFQEKTHLAQFDLFSLLVIFYCLIGHGQIGHGWVKQLGHNFFNDYCWILEYSGHDKDS